MTRALPSGAAALRIVRLACLAGMLGLWAPPLEAAGPSLTGPSVLFPLEFRSWTIERADGTETTLSQWYGGAVSTVRAGGRTSFVVSTAGARSESDVASGPTEELSGFSDVSVQMYHTFLDGRALVLAGVTLPSGTTGFTPAELDVADAMGDPLLGMRMKRYGGGLDVNAGAGFFLPLGSSVRLGVGGGILLPGSFTLIAGDPDFRPTHEISATAGIEIGRGPSAAFRRLSLRSTWRTYAEDELDGAAVFEEGDQFEVTLEAHRALGPVRTSLFSQLVMKDDNTSLQREGDAVEAIRSDPGTGFLAEIGCYLPLGSRWLAGAEGDWKRFQDGDAADRNGDAFSFGPAVSADIGGGAGLRVSVRRLTGSAGKHDALDLSGWSAAVSLLWRPEP